METTWKKALNNRRFVYALLAAATALLALTFFMPYFFGEIIAPKKGSPLTDIVMDWIGPTNWSWTIFTLIYSSAVLTIATNFRNPSVVFVGLATYTGVTWLRMLSIFLFTLEPPADIIVLVDPFLTLVVYPGSGGEFSKDLFFSGHVSSMTVFVLMEPNRWLRWIKLVATVAVGYLLIVQHVHYTLDILFAPLFTYGVYRAVLLLKMPLQY